MPGSQLQRHVLDQFPSPPDQQMTGNAHLRDTAEIGVYLRIKAVKEQIGDPLPAKFTWRQTDVMDYDQIDRDALRPLVTVW